MGIRGLTTYINNRSAVCMEDYKLHDNYLVIDGVSVAINIYFSNTRSNPVFGGDYDEYAHQVTAFFDKLLKCKVTPIVILDGALEPKKYHTALKRMKEVTCSVLYSDPSNPGRIIPVFITNVFVNILKQKQIKYVQCLFEADSDIAAVANILKCPVLSLDSDFYIFGVLYIPYPTLNCNITKLPNEQGYALDCKVYKIEKFLQSFRGLDKSMLPLAAILLGNDYVKSSTFSKFFRQMKSRRNARGLHDKIDAVFLWLSQFKLNTAITLILSRIPKHLREGVLNVIEKHITCYDLHCPKILTSLGFYEEYTTCLNSCLKKPFKYDGNIYDLNLMSGVNDSDSSDVNSDENDDTQHETDYIVVNVVEDAKYHENTYLAKLPNWFLSDIERAAIPGYLLNLIVHKVLIFGPKVEEFSLPPIHETGMKILATIYSLLLSGTHTKYSNAKVILRGKQGTLKYYQVVPEVAPIPYPSLHNLQDVSAELKKELLLRTLDIIDKGSLEELPSDWVLYIAAMKYWVQQIPQKYHKLNCYLYSLLFCMLSHLIDQKIGRHRRISAFNRIHGKTVLQIQEARKNSGKNAYIATDVTLQQARNELATDDCLLAAPFFISNFDVNEELYSNPKKFERIVVHAFNEFQFCLYQVINLNTLLGYPYKNPEIANMFNATLLYNVYNNFKKRNDVEVYIKTILQKSPTILHLVNSLVRKVEPLIPSVFQSNIKNKTKRKQVKAKSETKLEHSSETLEQQDTEESDDNSTTKAFYDANNRFSYFGSAL